MSSQYVLTRTIIVEEDTSVIGVVSEAQSDIGLSIRQLQSVIEADMQSYVAEYEYELRVDYCSEGYCVVYEGRSPVVYYRLDIAQVLEV